MPIGEIMVHSVEKGSIGNLSNIEKKISSTESTDMLSGLWKISTVCWVGSRPRKNHSEAETICGPTRGFGL